MGGSCQLVELHWEGSAPAACAAGLFHQDIKTSKKIFVQSNSDLEWRIANVLKLSQGLLIRLPCYCFLSEGLNHIIEFVICYMWVLLFGLCPPLFRTIKKREKRYEK